MPVSGGIFAVLQRVVQQMSQKARSAILRGHLSFGLSIHDAWVQVQDDIVSSLRLREPLRLISSFNRPKITYELVYQLETSPLSLQKKLCKLIQGIVGPDGKTPCCIVYTLKRETADEYARKLCMLGDISRMSTCMCSKTVPNLFMKAGYSCQESMIVTCL